MKRTQHEFTVRLTRDEYRLLCALREHTQTTAVQALRIAIAYLADHLGVK